MSNQIKEEEYSSQVDHLANIGFQAKPGDIYYMNPQKELNTYPMYIDNPQKIEKTLSSYISYTLKGTDITEKLDRRYSDFFSLYEKLLQRWPGIYIPPIPPKKLIGNMDPFVIKTRLRLLNRFCLNLSNIKYLYESEESNIFRKNISDVGIVINKLPELSLCDILTRMKEAFPEYNNHYDINQAKNKIIDFELFLKKSQEKLEDFTECVNIAEEKNEIDKKQYIELIEGFNNYEKSNMLIYADGNKNSLIFANPSNNDLYEKINKLKTEMINPFISIRDFLQEETLDIEAMFKAIKKFYNLLETEKELKLKLENLEEDIKREQKGEFNIFQSFFKAKEEIIKETEKEKELTQQKILDINAIIKIVGYHLENKIESFKKEKTQNYYKYLKIFAIMQREANKVIRELWSLVKSSLNDKEPQAIKEKKEAEKKNLEKLNKMKSKMIENQKRSRENNNNSGEMTEEQKNIKINEVLEDMCIYGTVTKKEIKEEKIKNPEKFIETNKALKMENQDEGIFALGLISQNLENIGIETAIESNPNSNLQEEESASLQFLSNGMINKKKYDLHFDLGKERNDELLDDEKEFEKFKEQLKLKLSKDYNIPPEKIIVTLPQKGSIHVQVIFQSEDFNNLDKKDFIQKFKNDKEFTELQNLKDIHEDVIISSVKLSKNQLDPRGNRNDGWGVDEKRGGKDYNPPIGWNGIGLRVLGKYDNGDNTWIGMDNVKGEWCVAYHGVGRSENTDKVKLITGIICKSSFKAGKNNVHENCKDVYHPGKKVGIGVYCTPNIGTAESYSGISEINGSKYKTVLMVRVKPEAIRHCTDSGDYWVVNGTIDEIRPYRILYKKC